MIKGEKTDYIIEKLKLDLNGIEPAPSLFISPKNANDNTPVILFNHSHGGDYERDKDEVLNSAPYMFPKSYTKVLTDFYFRN